MASEANVGRVPRLWDSDPLRSGWRPLRCVVRTASASTWISQRVYPELEVVGSVSGVAALQGVAARDRNCRAGTRRAIAARDAPPTEKVYHEAIVWLPDCGTAANSLCPDPDGSDRPSDAWT